MMAAAESLATLDTYLDFLDYSSDNEKERTIETPHIDRVLQQYGSRDKGSKKSDISNKDKVKKSVSEPSPGYGDRLYALEHQLKELIQNKQEKDKALKPHSKQNTSAKTRQVGTTSDGSSSDNENKKMSNVKRKTKHAINTAAEDKKIKSQLQSSRLVYYHGKDSILLKREYEEEKEKRWKSEQAAVKLAEHVRRLQLQAEEWQKKFESSVTKRTQLETALINEMDKVTQLQNEIKKLQAVQSDDHSNIDSLRKRCHDQCQRLKSYEEQLERLEKEHSSLFRETNDKLREAESQSAANERETLLQQQVVKKLELQIQQLQELLATREKEHQKELERLQPLEQYKVDEVIKKEIDRERLRFENINIQIKEKLQQQQKAYRDLEEEFRAALRIEAARYQQLETDHLKLTQETAVCHDNMMSLRKKDSEATSLIGELTAIVKEQKSHITELINSKQELFKQNEETKRQLDCEIAAHAKYEEKVTTLHEENISLSARLTAHESLLNGLREEKKLWSQELASQGAALAQDRGRLESQIESLTIQLTELKESNQNSKTTIRIRDKVIEDQVATIKDLKQETLELKKQLSSNQTNCLNKIETLQSELDEELSKRQQLQEQLDITGDQRLCYEEQLHEGQETIKRWKDKFNKLKTQWDERVGLISALEESVQQLQRKAKQREEELISERNTALLESKEALERLQLMKTRLQEESLAQGKAIEERMSEVIQEKDQQIDIANNRLAAVEDEMKEVLSQAAKERKAMEAKFQRLSNAFTDMQKELL